MHYARNCNSKEVRVLQFSHLPKPFLNLIQMNIQSNRCLEAGFSCLSKTQTVKNPTHLKPVSQLSRSFRWGHPVWACKFWTHRSQCQLQFFEIKMRWNNVKEVQQTCLGISLQTKSAFSHTENTILFLHVPLRVWIGWWSPLPDFGFPSTRECKYTNVSSKSSV